MNTKKIIPILWIVIMIAGIATPVMADTANVSVKWYIPSDLSMSVQYPTGNSAVDFKPASGTFDDEGADSQADGTYAFNVTNTGNVAINISGTFTTDLPANVEFFNLTLEWASLPTPDWFWVPANDTSSQWLVDNLAISGVEGFYANTTGTDVANDTYPHTKTFQLTSVAYT